MSVSVTMPRLGESVQEGTVTRWLKKEGDQVAADEPLLEVSTDKVDTEIPSPAAGVLSKITVGEDETVAVGAELAVIDDGGSAGQAEPAAATATKDAPAADEASGTTDAVAEQAEGPTHEELAEAGQRNVDTSDAPEPVEATAAEASPDDIPPAEPKDVQPEDPQPKAAAKDAAPAAEGDAGEEGDEGGGGYATPLVRRLATEQGVDLASVTGTGLGGRIRKQDVLDAAKSGGAKRAQPAAAESKPAARAAASAPSAPDRSELRGRTDKLSRLRTVIAQRMVESLQTSAQLTTVVEVDVTRVARLRDRAKASFEQREGTKLSFLPFFALAAIDGLKAHPVLNSSIDLDAGTATYHDAVHLGIAVDTDRGLLVPVIKDAGDLNIGGLARHVADLAERTRSNKVTPDELGGGTFTLTNTGSRGALFDTPIINQPQVAILGTGSVVKRPVVVDDPDLGEVIAVRSMVYLALTYDHRIVDGADAARYLLTVKERLEEGRFHASLGLDPE